MQLPSFTCLDAGIRVSALFSPTSVYFLYLSRIAVTRCYITLHCICIRNYLYQLSQLLVVDCMFSACSVVHLFASLAMFSFCEETTWPMRRTRYVVLCVTVT